jgi:hypothetical protein
MSLLLGTFETCRRKLRMSAYRRRPKVTGARSIGVLTRRSRKQKALARDRGSRPSGPGRSTVPPLVQGFEVRQDRAGPRAQRWLMWPNTNKLIKTVRSGARSKKRKTVHRVLAPDQDGVLSSPHPSRPHTNLHLGLYTIGLSQGVGYPRTAVLAHRSVTHVRYHCRAEQEYQECQQNQVPPTP